MKSSSARLERYVRRLAETFGPRDAEHPGNLNRVAAYLRETFAEHTARVGEQSYQVGAIPYRNVMARFGPETPARIVVGAHYDVAGPYPGADDNASGIAGVLELARLLSSTPLPTEVELVAYPLEEPPFFGTDNMGSAIHAQSLKAENVSVRAMLALEMIGYFSDAPQSQGFPLFVLRPFYPSTGNFIVVASHLGQYPLVKTVKTAMRSASPLPVHSINAPRLLPGIALSDHRNYWKAGYDAAMITDTAFYRNPHYHTAQDTPDTLDYERMAMVVDGVRVSIKALGTQ